MQLTLQSSINKAEKMPAAYILSIFFNLFSIYNTARWYVYIFKYKTAASIFYEMKIFLLSSFHRIDTAVLSTCSVHKEQPVPLICPAFHHLQCPDQSPASSVGIP